MAKQLLQLISSLIFALFPLTILCQSKINNQIRSSTSPLTFYLVFDSSFSLQTSNTQLNFSPEVNLVSGATISEVEGSDQTVFQVTYVATEIQKSTTVTITFTGDQIDPLSGSDYLENKELSLDLLPLTALSEDEADMLDLYVNLDSWIGYGWTFFCLIAHISSPGNIIFAYSKLLREAVDSIKMTNINIQPSYLSFFSRSNNQVSGLKLFNVLDFLIYDNSIISGYLRDEDSVKIDERIDALQMVPLSQKITQFHDSPLFLDNLGLLVFLIAVLLVVMLILQLSTIPCYDNQQNRIKLLRILRWNYFCATIIGSSYSIFYYGFQQLYISYNSFDTTNNIIGFAFSTALVLLTLVSVCLIPLKFRQSTEPEAKYSMKQYYRIVHQAYKLKKGRYSFSIMGFIGLGLIMSIINQLPMLSGFAQLTIDLSLSLIFFVLMVVFQPFKRKRYLVFFIIIWVVFIAHLTGAYMIAIMDNFNNGNENIRDIACYMMMASWGLIPVVGGIFGLIEFCVGLVEGGKEDNPMESSTVVPVMENSNFHQKVTQNSIHGGNEQSQLYDLENTGDMKDRNTSMVAGELDNSRAKLIGLNSNKKEFKFSKSKIHEDDEEDEESNNNSKVQHHEDVTILGLNRVLMQSNQSPDQSSEYDKIGGIGKFKAVSSEGEIEHNSHGESTTAHQTGINSLLNSIVSMERKHDKPKPILRNGQWGNKVYSSNLSSPRSFIGQEMPLDRNFIPEHRRSKPRLMPLHDIPDAKDSRHPFNRQKDQSTQSERVDSGDDVTNMRSNRVKGRGIPSLAKIDDFEEANGDQMLASLSDAEIEKINMKNSLILADVDATEIKKSHIKTAPKVYKIQKEKNSRTSLYTTDGDVNDSKLLDKEMLRMVKPEEKAGFGNAKVKHLDITPRFLDNEKQSPQKQKKRSKSRERKQSTEDGGNKTPRGILKKQDSNEKIEETVFTKRYDKRQYKSKYNHFQASEEKARSQKHRRSQPSVSPSKNSSMNDLDKQSRRSSTKSTKGQKKYRDLDEDLKPVNNKYLGKMTPKSRSGKLSPSSQTMLDFEYKNVPERSSKGFFKASINPKYRSGDPIHNIRRKESEAGMRNNESTLSFNPKKY